MIVEGSHGVCWGLVVGEVVEAGGDVGGDFFRAASFDAVAGDVVCGLAVFEEDDGG